MTIQKQNTLDEAPPWTSWFFAGDTGSGKTTALGTFPRPLIIEPGNESSSTTLSEQGVAADVWRIYSMDDMLQAIKDLLSDYNKSIARDDDSIFPYDTVGLESITHYTGLVIEALTVNHEEDMNQKRWGQLTAHLLGLHNRLVTLDVHLVYTSLVDFREKESKLLPMVEGKAKTIIPSACNAVGFCDVSRRHVKKDKKVKEVTEYVTYFRQHRSFPARSRYRWVPEEVRNFNFAELYDSVFNNNQQED